MHRKVMGFSFDREIGMKVAHSIPVAALHSFQIVSLRAFPYSWYSKWALQRVLIAIQCEFVSLSTLWYFFGIDLLEDQRLHQSLW